LGLEVISSESATSAGRVDPENNNVDSGLGLRLGRHNNRLLDAAFKAGITTAISSLRFTGSLGASTTAFQTGSKRSSGAAVYHQYSSMECRVGENAKQKGLDSSIPGQMQRIFHSQCDKLNANAANHILPFVKTRNLTIIGGAEAHIVADQMQSKVSIILSPARCTPSDWNKQDCILAATTPTAVDILKAARINVGVSVSEDNMARGLIWEAGWKIADSKDFKNMSVFEFAKNSAALVTWNIAKAYNLQDVAGEIRVGMKPNFVVYDGVPGTLQAKVKLVVDGDLIESKTEQY
jgi:hypothetical protein